MPGSHTRPRSLRSTSTIITFSAWSLGLASSSRASARSSSRVRPRGRVPLIGSVRRCRPGVHGEERLRRGRQQRPRRARRGRRAEVQVAREQRRVAGPEPAEQRPRVAAERRLEPSGQVRLVDLAPPDCRRGRASTCASQSRCEVRDAELGRDGGLHDGPRIRHGTGIRQVPAEVRGDPRLDLEPAPAARSTSPSTARTPSHASPCAGPRRSPSRGARAGARGRCWSTRARSGSRSNRRPRS